MRALPSVSLKNAILHTPVSCSPANVTPRSSSSCLASGDVGHPQRDRRHVGPELGTEGGRVDQIQRHVAALDLRPPRLPVRAVHPQHVAVERPRAVHVLDGDRDEVGALDGVGHGGSFGGGFGGGAECGSAVSAGDVRGVGGWHAVSRRSCPHCWLRGGGWRCLPAGTVLDHPTRAGAGVRLGDLSREAHRLARTGPETVARAGNIPPHGRGGHLTQPWLAFDAQPPRRPAALPRQPHTNHPQGSAPRPTTPQPPPTPPTGYR